MSHLFDTLLKAEFTLSKTGAGANCAISGTGAGTIYNAYTIVSGVAGKIFVPVFAVNKYVFSGAPYTGGGNIYLVYSGATTVLVLSAENSFGGSSDKNCVCVCAANTVDWRTGQGMQVQGGAAFTDNGGTANGTGNFSVYYYELTP